jgi:hypothetical protein
MDGPKRIGHYYGDIVRKLFIAGALVMLASLPLVQLFVPLPVFLAILVILVVVLAAGFLAPTQKWTMIVDMCIAGASMLAFEDYAVQSYFDGRALFFVVNQALAIIFFVAFYYAVKTVRGTFFADTAE